MKHLILLSLVACASYTDPEQEKITYYKCDNDYEIMTKHSDDYETLVIKYNKRDQATLHSFVTASGVGYSNPNLLWLTKGKEAVLIEKKSDGTENYLFKKCKTEKVKLQY